MKRHGGGRLEWGIPKVIKSKTVTVRSVWLIGLTSVLLRRGSYIEEKLSFLSHEIETGKLKSTVKDETQCKYSLIQSREYVKTLVSNCINENKKDKKEMHVVWNIYLHVFICVHIHTHV